MLFSSLRMRLIAICVSIIVFAMLALAIANFFTTRRHTLQSLEMQVQQLSQSYAENIGNWVAAKKTVITSMGKVATASDAMPFLTAAEQAGAFDLAYVGFADKRILFSKPQPGLPADYDPTVRPWYVKASQANEPILTAPYNDASSGKLVITFAQAVKTNDAVSSVVASDMLLDNVVNTVVSIKPSPNSFAFLLDGSGNIIVHPNKDLNLKPVSAISKDLSSQALAAIEQSKKSSTMDFNGRDGVLYVTRVAGTDWMLAVVLDYAEATEALSAMLMSSAIVAVVMIALAALVLSVLIAHSLKRLDAVRDALEDIASGDADLTRRIDTHGSDELAQIASAFNRFADKISSVLAKIRAASDSVKVGANEIADGNLDLSSRTEEQASSLQETAATMEELTSTVKQNTDNARQANQLATTASDVAIKGGAVVSQVVETMGSINESSGKVVDIIRVIDGIAFQTNILALNAAVEAARAGEQGRGFAVVAGEVRALAQRSAAAAKEIKVLIDDSVEKVEVGTRLVGEAGTTMDEVVGSVKRVTDIMGEILAASEEQKTGIEQVNTAITQMDQVTQQNAALVEEAAAAADSLQEQATSLHDAVGTFKLGEHHAPAALAASTAVKPKAVAKPVVKPAQRTAVALGKPRSVPVKATADEWEEF